MADRITTDKNSPAESDLAIVASYRDLLTAYRLRPEHKFTASDGAACTPSSAGQLRRGPVTLAPAGLCLIGKEANRLEEVQAGIVGSIDEILTDYTPDTEFREFRDLVLPVLARYGGRDLARIIGIDRRSIDRIRAGSTPRESHRASLTLLSASLACRDLRLAEHPPGISQVRAVLAQWKRIAPVQQRYGVELLALDLSNLTGS